MSGRFYWFEQRQKYKMIFDIGVVVAGCCCATEEEEEPVAKEWGPRETAKRVVATTTRRKRIESQPAIPCVPSKDRAPPRLLLMLLSQQCRCLCRWHWRWRSVVVGVDSYRLDRRARIGRCDCSATNDLRTAAPRRSPTVVEQPEEEWKLT